MEPKLMRWYINEDRSVVRLEFLEGGSWKPYKHHPLSVPDYRDGGSPGYATMQKLLSLGYVFVSVDK